jgi:hypothetical protein
MAHASTCTLRFPARLLSVAASFVLAFAAARADNPPGATPPGKSNWWSFQPARRRAVPKIALGDGHSTLANPIDAFIQSKLGELKLRPSPPADRVTLIRRVTYDLTGLPPSPEAIRAFVADVSPEAYDQLVDRLLASPHYGERWARHWLDVVHFGETHGYDKDKLRPNAWPYRDYVIRSFNQDKAYSRFVEEQLAGDVLYPDEPDGILALGFIAAGPWDFVGHVELPESKTDGLIARYNDRDDMVMTVMATLQSFTVHCARCHDHKFDPITQKDYYGLQAVFAGVDRANRPYDPDKLTLQKRRALESEKKSVEARQRELQEVLAHRSSPQSQRLDQEISDVRRKLDRDAKPGAKSPSNGYHSHIEPEPSVTKWVQVDLGRSVALDEVRLVPARPTDFPDTPGFGFPVRFKVELSDDEQFTKSALLADYTSADFKNPGDNPLLLPVRGGQASDGTTPVSSPQPPGDAIRYIRVTATRLWERTRDYVFALAELQAFADGTNVSRGSAVTAHDSIEAGRWAMKNLVDGYSSRARLEDVARTPAMRAERTRLEAEARRLGAERQRVLESLVPSDVKAESTRLESRLAELNKALASLPEPKLVYAAANEFKPEGSFHSPKGTRPVYLLTRGDVQRPQELMVPAALAAVPGPNPTFALPADHPEGSRRAALAQWLTDARNLQTRRSIVNRVWQYHFGRGIVETPNDFGHMGALPTHPELLDWLAFWFLDHGESLKQLHQLMVTSATYRQISQPPAPSPGRSTDRENWEQAATRDADNRYLWRMNRTRLDAECIRDAMLLISGRLDLRMGGPSDRQFYFKDDHSPVYDYTRFDVDSPAGARRSIYRHIVRSVTDPFMDCLDSADPSQLVARRNTTLTALQALATLNNPFVLRQCEHFAGRLGQLSQEVPAQVDAAYWLALGRPPTAEEKSRLGAYARKHGLANACRVLFNSSEFMFVD